LIEIGSKTAQKDAAQTNKQTKDKKIMAMNQKLVTESVDKFTFTLSQSRTAVKDTLDYTRDSLH